MLLHEFHLAPQGADVLVQPAYLAHEFTLCLVGAALQAFCRSTGLRKPTFEVTPNFL